ncbi:MAG TPA: hypothetical protein VGC39_00215 [Candidatus Methylacidiphilales bacterium]
MGREPLELAWWEVLLFICTFGIFAPIIHRSFNRKYLRNKSNILYLFRHGVNDAETLQNQIDSILLILTYIWAAIMFIALVRTDFDFVGLFLPYLGDKADPWSRGRVGTGLDSLIALAGYALVGLTAAFGVIAALATHKKTRALAILVYGLALPTYIFDRTRNTMLATLLPGFLAWVFLRVRGSLIIRIAILMVGFLVLDAWLKFIIQNRSDTTIVAAFQEKLKGNTSGDATVETKHLGLNMMEELGHINEYIGDGSYHPNWGERYFAELVNPIPRVLWPGKPLIGIDYAMARGLSYGQANDRQGGVAASVSTGMIGQGVVNFGGFLGPIAAALLMALWAAIIARQDLLAGEAGRLFLYAIGLFFTFNLGRDITLLVTYPFIFGYLLLLVAKKWQSGKQKFPAPAAPKGKINPPPAAAVSAQASPPGRPGVFVSKRPT